VKDKVRDKVMDKVKLDRQSMGRAGLLSPSDSIVSRKLMHWVSTQMDYRGINCGHCCMGGGGGVRGTLGGGLQLGQMWGGAGDTGGAAYSWGHLWGSNSSPERVQQERHTPGEATEETKVERVTRETRKVRVAGATRTV